MVRGAKGGGSETMSSTLVESRAQKRAAREASRRRIEAVHAETQRVVASGQCPRCGRGLRRNLALAGWWQCEQYGAEGFRKDPAAAPCGWQGFTA